MQPGVQAAGLSGLRLAYVVKQQQMSIMCTLHRMLKSARLDRTAAAAIDQADPVLAWAGRSAFICACSIVLCPSEHSEAVQLWPRTATLHRARQLRLATAPPALAALHTQAPACKALSAWTRHMNPADSLWAFMAAAHASFAHMAASSIVSGHANAVHESRSTSGWQPCRA